MPAIKSGRLIAVEEHFVTSDYFSNAETLEVPTREEPERAFVKNFSKSVTMMRRFTDFDLRIREMDGAGIDISILSLNPPGVQIYSDAKKASALAISANDALAEIIRRNPTRLYGLGSVAPQDPKAAADEVKRVMNQLRLGGILIGSHTHGSYLDEPACEPILSALEEADATLYLHPRSPSPQMLDAYKPYGMVAALWGFQAEAGIHAMRLILSGTLDRHPGLRIVLGHLGEALPFWLWRLDNIYEKTFQWAGEALGMVKLRLKPSEYVHRNFWVTTSGMSDPEVFSYVLRKLGPERILFAVDYPYEDSRAASQLLTQSGLNQTQHDLITHRNAERIFRVSPASPKN